MMKRKQLAGVLIAVGALHTSLALALGLGNMAVHSSLNQPLAADIPLQDTGDLDPSQIRVGLASADEFQRAGIERTFFLNDLHFKVTKGSNGKAVIHVTTDKLVREPYLDFLLEVHWPSGRVLREYTVLVDLPAAAATSPAAGSRLPAKTAEPAQENNAAASNAPATAVSGTAAGTTTGDRIRVARNDTLWQLSQRVRPANASVQQTMLALQQTNPQAFTRNNINGLQAGRVLRVPSAETIRALPQQQAVQQVARQNSAWSTTRRPLEGGRQSAVAATSDHAKSGYMRLASAGDGHGGVGDGDGKDNAGALSQQLTAARENLDSAKRENTELNSRVADLKKQLDTLQKLVQLKDNQLATLQAQAAATDQQQAAEQAGAGNQTAAADSDETVAGTDVAGTANTGDGTATSTMSADQTHNDQQGSTDNIAAAAPAAKQVASAQQPANADGAPEVRIEQPTEPGLIDRLTSSPLYGALAAALVALLGFGWWYSRRQRPDEVEGEGSFFDTFDGEMTADAEPSEALAVHAGAGYDDADDTAAIAGDDTTETRPMTGDAIAEAEVYRSYGRDDESRSLLLKALDDEPERSDMRLKLMEYQVADDDRDGFRAQYTALTERADRGALAEAAALLAGSSATGDWLAGLADEAPESAPASAEHAEDDAIAADTDTDNDADTADLDFDLGLDTAAADDDLDATRPRAVLDVDADPLETVSDDSSSLGEDDTDLDAAFADIATGEDDRARGESESDAPADDALEFDLSDIDLDLGDDLDPIDTGDDLSGEFTIAPAEGDSTDTDSSVGSETSAEESVSFDMDDNGIDFEPADTAASGVDTDDDALTDKAQPAWNRDNVEIDSESDAGAASGSDDDAFAIDTVDDAQDLDSVLESGDDDLEVLGDADEVATKLDLARAYIDMGDVDGAREILDEVLAEGSDGQKQEASELLATMTG